MAEVVNMTRVHTLLRKEIIVMATLPPSHQQAASGYAWLHQREVTSADTGADPDFPKVRRGDFVVEHSH